MFEKRGSAGKYKVSLCCGVKGVLKELKAHTNRRGAIGRRPVLGGLLLRGRRHSGGRGRASGLY